MKHFPFIGILGLIFITLKLCKVITWSWWWVTSPFWGGFALAAFILLTMIILSKVNSKIKYSKKSKKDIEDKYNEIKKKQSKSRFQQRLDEALEANEKQRIKD